MKHRPYIKYNNIYVIPTFHARIEFAKLVRASFVEVFPDCVAVELPGNIFEEVLDGVRRLPYLSLLTYADTLNPKSMNIIPIDPGDSIIEAIKLSQEFNVPLEFIDLSLKEYQPPGFLLPDDYSINKLGLRAFYEKISSHFEKQYKTKKDLINQEIKLQDFLQDQEENLSSEEQNPTDFSHIDIFREKYMACNLLKLSEIYNRILLVIGMSHWDNIKLFLEHPSKLEDIEIELEPFKHVKLYNVKSEDARFLLKELPFHTTTWVQFKEKYDKKALETINNPDEFSQILKTYDKTKNIRKIFLRAKDDFEREFKEFINLHKLKTLFQYSRNLSLAENKLLPNLFQLLTASKNVVDDDFAWKVMEYATKYPFNDESNKYETIELAREGAVDADGRVITLRRRHPYRYEKEREVPLEKRPKEKYPGEWRDEWEKEKNYTVSYPPEDILEEDYFAFIRKKAIKNLKEQRIKIEEFKSSLMDGIAIKETIRNWATQQKIYVKNEQKIKGKIDTLIVIFDKDDGKREKYPYKLTWYAEHDKESDMAFYATFPGDYLIGPGISHVEVGGLLSIFPPPYLPEIFAPYMNYQYEDTHNKAERLLKAGIFYSKEKYIAYVAKEPPRKYFHSMAGVKGRKIVYIPLDTFSHESLKTIKHIHILAGRNKRKIAHKYIFLD
ncbi:MAG: putative TraB determinant protein [Promethearchaeota archaeon]|nr:MAG: putative TraB determinant protein [Candidatus Lokiarchaeota archaeon]